MDEKASPLAEVPEHDMPDDLGEALGPRLEGLRVSAQLENEAVLPVHLPLPDAPCAGEHARCSQWIQALKGTSERANRALGGMGAEPRGMAPHELAIAAGVHLAPADGQLDVPHLGSHLPEHEAARLGAAGGIAVLDEAAGVLELGGHHAHLAHDVGVAHGGEQLVPAGGRQVLLQDVLRRRGLLWEKERGKKGRVSYRFGNSKFNCVLLLDICAVSLNRTPCRQNFQHVFVVLRKGTKKVVRLLDHTETVVDVSDGVKRAHKLGKEDEFYSAGRRWWVIVSFYGVQDHELEN